MKGGFCDVSAIETVGEVFNKEVAVQVLQSSKWNSSSVTQFWIEHSLPCAESRIHLLSVYTLSNTLMNCAGKEHDIA